MYIYSPGGTTQGLKSTEVRSLVRRSSRLVLAAAKAATSATGWLWAHMSKPLESKLIA